MPRWVRFTPLLLAAIVAFGAWQTRAPGPDAPAQGAAGDARVDPERYPGFLPAEAIETLRAIERGGPFPYDRDGTVFQNREGRLPPMARGYYREYTVRTPGSRDRGARRIVAGGRPPEVFYYTDDHYRTFRRVEVPR